MKKKFKITLVIPSESADSPYPLQESKPLIGVGSLAGILMRYGYSVDIIDAFAENLSAYEVFKRIIGLNSRVVGISMHLLAYDFASKLANLCKNENISVIVGGPEVTLNSGKVLDKIKPDVAVIGEGEYTFIELIKLFEEEGVWNYNSLRSVEGIAYRETGGSIFRTPKRSRISDLDNLPFVPYEKFPMGFYDLRQDILSKAPVYPVYTSRGCPYNCSFCSSREIWDRKCFFMSGKRVVDEVEHIIRKFSPKGIYFQDDHFTLNTKRVVDICEEILKRGIKVKWMCLGRAQRLDEELLRLMKRAGCKGMWFGIESGSKRILSFIRKEIDQDEIFSAIRAGKRAGLAIGASIIVGFPTQTLVEEMETIEFLKKAKCTIVWFTPYVGYPGSDMYREFLTDNGKYCYDKEAGVILPNSEDMTWPQKVEWAKYHSLKFNLTFRRFLYQTKAIGISETVKMAARKVFST